jgi:P-type E1-E2 ATPase
MVRLMRIRDKKITLAVGDGANDCNMIQEANIGVGIYGNEGMRAVLTADFAIGEFQVLDKLLFVHGRQNYVRISNMILYFFYKNMIFTIP